jgi:cbb3-type cytochrome oxidase cytochrome c subunit
MAQRDRPRRALAITALTLLAAASLTSLLAAAPKMSRPYSVQLAEGRGGALAEQRCLMCHSAMMITQQHKDSAAWARTVSTMKTWGTPLDSAETDTLMRWLVASYPPRPSANPSDPKPR